MSDCCQRPTVSVFDYTQDETTITNRVCTQCWRHWHGPPDGIHEFSRQEWIAQMQDWDKKTQPY